jgi:hypothetical protein
LLLPEGRECQYSIPSGRFEWEIRYGKSFLPGPVRLDLPASDGTSTGLTGLWISREDVAVSEVPELPVEK